MLWLNMWLSVMNHDTYSDDQSWLDLINPIPWLDIISSILWFGLISSSLLPNLISYSLWYNLIKYYYFILFNYFDFTVINFTSSWKVVKDSSNQIPENMIGKSQTSPYMGITCFPLPQNIGNLPLPIFLW